MCQIVLGTAVVGKETELAPSTQSQANRDPGFPCSIAATMISARPIVVMSCDWRGLASAERPQADVLDDEAHQGRHSDADDTGDPERKAVVDHERVGHRCAEHEDRAVREIEDVEDAEDQRVTHREQRINGSDEDRVEDLLVHYCDAY